MKEWRRSSGIHVIVVGAVLAGCGGPSASPRPSAAETAGGAARDAPPEHREEPRVAERDARPPRVPPHGPLADDDLRRGVLARLADPPFPSCTVAPLPPALRRRARGDDDLASLQRLVSAPVPATSITAGRSGEGEVIVYRSSRLDPASELGDAGYRVRLGGGGGASEDLALGLTALRPFVLVHNPMVALLDDGVLQLEAELRALDDTSVDFRPAGPTRTARDGRERLVRCALDDLRRDQDDDGLTDLEEQRLLTDPWDPDTDGDGIRDGDDASPLGSAAPVSEADQVWREAALALTREGEGLHVVVRAGDRLDLGAREREDAGRVLVLREDELAAYQRRFGLRAPVVIAVTMRAPGRAEVVIDRVWSQRTLEARKDSTGAWSLAAREAPRDASARRTAVP